MSTSHLFRSAAGRVAYQLMADKKPPRPTDPEFARRIRQAMDEYAKPAGKSNAEVAREVGVTPQSATKWKNRGYLDKRRIPAFCRACNVSIEWLLTGEGDPQVSNVLQGLTADEITQTLLKYRSCDEQMQILEGLVAVLVKGKVRAQREPG